MKLVSWNVNGIRAVLGKGFLGWLEDCGADVVCLQETRARETQLADVPWPSGWHRFWHSAERGGYSGTAVFSRMEPRKVTRGMPQGDPDREGRLLTVEFEEFTLVNVYTPNSQNELRRLDYRINRWDPAFREHITALDRIRPVVFCGDLNVAHHEIDLARPRDNTRSAGFTREERDSFSRHLEAGFVDSFRHFETGSGHYSWWSYRAGARARNIGWRIDYFCVARRLLSRVSAAAIHPEVQGSDHCPVSLDLARAR